VGSVLVFTAPNVCNTDMGAVQSGTPTDTFIVCPRESLKVYFREAKFEARHGSLCRFGRDLLSGEQPDGGRC